MAREPGGPPWRILAVDGDPAVQAFYRGALAARSPGAAAPEGAAPYGEEAWRDMTFDVVVCASSHEALPLAREARQPAQAPGPGLDLDRLLDEPELGATPAPGQKDGS